MKKKSLTFLFPLLTLIVLTAILNRKIFAMPPLGVLLNPFIGAVQNEKKLCFDQQLNYGRENNIEILFDERSIPHVFAESEKDLFFSQGYVTASDRLWQIDFLSYIAAGRLCEILGEGPLNYDRAQRRSGILSSAKTSLKFLEADRQTKQALDNYTEGVNAYIKQTSEIGLPFEYKLLDYRPEPWSNLKSVLIMKYMGALLSGYEEDVESSYLYAAIGKKEYDKLFSNYLIDKNKKRFSIAFFRDSLPIDAYIDFSFLESSPQIPNSAFNPRLGSNSWVLGPKKSASGSAILCNDPHLNLSFPAIWYEIQLKSKEMNVYGYSIPGTPGVIIGYNENISWGLTNGQIDVCNLFKLELKDNYSQYKYDGLWKNTEQNIEEIIIRNHKSFYDTIYCSIHGPIISDFRFGPKERAGLAMDWTLHDPSNEFLTFIKLNKASNYSEFKDAIKHYRCPVQSFTYADVKGNIATHLQGKILKSHWSGKGKFVLDGTKSDYLATELLYEELPFTCNPEEGFVCSANNNPFHQSDSFYVYGHYSELRSDKIKQILSKPGKLKLKDMQLMQLDNTNHLAELAVPILLDFISTNDMFKKKFSEWDYKYDKESEMPLLFNCWWSLIENNTWDELKKYPKSNKIPDNLVLLDLIINDPTNKYFDKMSTDKIETAEDIVLMSQESLVQSWHILPMKWGNYNQASIMHLLNISALSEKRIPSSGHPDAINALSANWGPSLRFIVEMDKIPQGYGVYAGGQSGNPASVKYDQFLDNWENGGYYKLNFFMSKEAAQKKTKYKWIIK
ncbi:MAG: penicillin acylase family protein [Bacteroidota bacterium]|nr:penicillin acylase family protein [Bacteroidota bacterium]